MHLNMTMGVVSVITIIVALVTSAPSQPIVAAPNIVNMTVCKEKCNSDCKTYFTPASSCYNPQVLFPRDPQWGSFDVLDECVSDRLLKRSFFSSTDGSCFNRTDGFDLPTNECVGPFGQPRPWGSFNCITNHTFSSLT
eukprot:m.266547 g.266547  ORF g.266547 m.266547 type:complete len:138 (-) comp67975_c0_seq1:148-561(-)